MEKFSIAVADFFDDDWERDDLAEHVSEAVDFVCLAYGVLDEDTDEYEQEKGSLSRFGDFSLSRIVESEEFLNWFQRNLEVVADFIREFEILAAPVVDEFEEAVERIDSVARYVPLVGSLKGLLNTGCSLHAGIDRNGEASREAYTRFFKNAALVAVEIVLLAIGAGGSYRIAYGTAGWINRRLINAVGSSIGWSAYSWVLSQIHWGIRVTYAGSSGLAIEKSVEEVTEAVIEDAASQGTELAWSEVESNVREDVEQIALEAADGPEVWVLKAERTVDELLPDLPDSPTV